MNLFTLQLTPIDECFGELMALFVCLFVFLTTKKNFVNFLKQITKIKSDQKQKWPRLPVFITNFIWACWLKKVYELCLAINMSNHLLTFLAYLAQKIDIVLSFNL